MAVPKKKTSRARKNRRKSVWANLEKDNLVECPQCHELKMPHHICHRCGYFRGIQYLVIEEIE